jgi:hypothetical protein
VSTNDYFKLQLIVTGLLAGIITKDPEAIAGPQSSNRMSGEPRDDA